MSTCGSAGLLPALLPVCLVATFGGAGSAIIGSRLTTVVTAEEEEELPLLPPL